MMFVYSTTIENWRKYLFNQTLFYYVMNVYRGFPQLVVSSETRRVSTAKIEPECLEPFSPLTYFTPPLFNELNFDHVYFSWTFNLKFFVKQLESPSWKTSNYKTPISYLILVKKLKGVEKQFFF